MRLHRSELAWLTLVANCSTKLCLCHIMYIHAVGLKSVNERIPGASASILVVRCCA
jgi:hypothetical protein